MICNYTKKIKKPFEQVVSKLKKTLHEEGFEIITNMNVSDTLQKNQGINFRKYKVLGACNLKLAYKLITHESHMGLMLPCNILIQEHENGEVELSAINPMESMDETMNPDIISVTKEISEKLGIALNHVN